VPVVVVLVAVTVAVALPDPVTDAGLNETDVPAGNPLALRVTDPLNPFSAPMVTVHVALPPTVTFCEPGVTEIEKSCVTGMI
jgi:hypothetical protein